MAGLINRRGRWYARISLWDGLKNKEKQIPLITKDYSTALIRKKEIEKVEINPAIIQPTKEIKALGKSIDS